MIAYHPLVLKNLVEITAYFGVGKETVLKWVDQGAPVAVEKAGGGSPRYSAEAAALQEWRRQTAQMKNRGEGGNG